jgi:hypothetical protein
MSRATPPGEHFTWAEFEGGRAAAKVGGITVAPEHEPAVRALCVNVLDPVREVLGGPVEITSGYRTDETNRLIKGSPTSQHKSGEAADIKGKDARRRRVSAEALARIIVAHATRLRPGDLVRHSPRRTRPRQLHDDPAQPPADLARTGQRGLFPVAAVGAPMTPLAAILAIAREAAPLRELVRRLPLPIVRRAMEDLGAEPDDRFADLLGYAISIADELDDLFRPGSIASATAPIADDVIAAILEVADGPAFCLPHRRALPAGRA